MTEPPPPRHRSSATPLTLLYGALIVYASLYPFEGWRTPSASVWQFLSLPWPRWWTAFDVWANLLGYMPLGAFVFIAAVRSGWRAHTAWLFAALCGLGLSLLLETLQNFLPQRVPSNLDAALNLSGAAAGAALGVLAHARGGIERWQIIRDRWFERRSAGGLVLLLLWPLGLLFPQPLPLAVGQMIPRVRDAIQALVQDTPAEAWVQAWLQPTTAAPVLAAWGDTLLVALGLLGPCLVACVVSLPSWRRAALCVGALGVGVVTTTLSTAMNFAPQHALAWATPNALQALLAGSVVSLLLAWLPRRAAAAFGLLVLAASVLLVTQAPADPYFASSLQAWEQGRFIRFHGAAQWVGWLWPYVTMFYLLGVVSERGSPDGTR